LKSDALKRAALVALPLVLVCVLSGACVEGDDEEPGAVSDLAFFFKADALAWNGKVTEGDTAGTPDTRILAWTSTGDDKRDGEASLYDIRYFKQSELDELGKDARSAFYEFWGRAGILRNEPCPGEAGELEQFFLPRLDTGETVWFAMKVKDEVGNISDISNIEGPVRIRRLSVPVRPAAGGTAFGFGAALAAAADVNNDFLQDMLVGAPSQGKAVLVLGRSNDSLVARRANLNGISVLSAVPELTPAFTLVGEGAEEFGADVAGLYDLNGDEFDDMGVGAPGLDRGATVDAGAVYVKFGSDVLPSTLSADSVDVIIRGDEDGGMLGYALAPAFDLDQDTRPEFMAGAPGAFGTGAVYVFKGQGLVSGDASSAFVIIKGEALGDSLGAALSSVGDVNGDGVRDLAVAAPYHNGGAGAVYVFYGGDAGALNWPALPAGGTVFDLATRKADVTIRGTGAGARFGKALSAGGNLAGDSDLAFDFAVSADDKVYVFFGGASGAVPFPAAGSSVEALDSDASAVLSGAAGEEFGADIAGAGDLNGDGISDLVVGAPGAEQCRIFRGPVTHSSLPDDFMLSPAAGSDFCRGLAGVGDLNLDGFADVLVGAPLAGQAFLSF